jgi:hypothetical protein
LDGCDPVAENDWIEESFDGTGIVEIPETRAVYRVTVPAGGDGYYLVDGKTQQLRAGDVVAFLKNISGPLPPA